MGCNKADYTHSGSGWGDFPDNSSRQHTDWQGGQLSPRYANKAACWGRGGTLAHLRSDWDVGSWDGTDFLHLQSLLQGKFLVGCFLLLLLILGRLSRTKKVPYCYASLNFGVLRICRDFIRCRPWKKETPANCRDMFLNTALKQYLSQLLCVCEVIDSDSQEDIQ